ncbi:MAG: tetratricopeptide repeat protein [Chitinispirillales bacterium]|jgi:tetratricopeptide (TPR) repeat protein|nr:tetratricopeptide repeat protein [Chitinispirillales bacterium]
MTTAVLLLRKALCLITVLALFAPICADEVRKLNKKANRLYGQGKYEEALKLYEDALLLDPSDNKLKMNRGSTLYRLKNMEEAENSYLGSLSQTDKNTLADAHYNLGNILYGQGQQFETSGDPGAREKYSQAVENYIQTLKLRPNDADAKWNLQLAHQKVDLLENQDQDEKNDKKDEQDKNQDNKQGDKNDNRDEKNNDQQNKDDKEQQNQDKENQDKENQQEQNQQEQNGQEQTEQDMKKEEAERLIELYADDADTLSKPQFKRGKVRQPEKDW